MWRTLFSCCTEWPSNFCISLKSPPLHKRVFAWRKVVKWAHRVVEEREYGNNQCKLTAHHHHQHSTHLYLLALIE